MALAALSLLITLATWRRTRKPSRSTATSLRKVPRPVRTGQLSSTQVTDELAALRSEVSSSLRHLAVVRYDAFGDMGGHLSWSIALLDDTGDGVVLTSIHGRSDSRTYAKNVAGWTANQQLSPEEQEAIGFARASNG
ncbi:MAG: DUF4446 family protein [Nocardioidaceae bacterium]|nr:DUF4446 family protein [Nocardioidaceae bacterium]